MIETLSAQQILLEVVGADLIDVKGLIGLGLGGVDGDGASIAGISDEGELAVGWGSLC